MTDRSYDEETLRKIHEAELEILRDFLDLCEKNNITYFGVGGTAIGAIRHGGFIPWDDDIDIAMPRKDYERFLRLADKYYGDKYFLMNGKNYPNYPLLTTRWTMKGTEFVEWPLKDIDLPFGIFLDLYPFDQIPDDEKKFRRQAVQAFFWSKLLILRSIPHPVLPFSGIKAKIVQPVCGMIHWFLKTLNVSSKWLYQMCHRVSVQYNGKAGAKRFDFLCDTTAYLNIYDYDDIYPLKTIKFEGLDLKFPNRIEDNLNKMFGDFMQLPPEDKRKNHYPYKLKFKDE